MTVEPASILLLKKPFFIFIAAYSSVLSTLLLVRFFPFVVHSPSPPIRSGSSHCFVVIVGDIVFVDGAIVAAAVLATVAAALAAAAAAAVQFVIFLQSRLQRRYGTPFRMRVVRCQVIEPWCRFQFEHTICSIIGGSIYDDTFRVVVVIVIVITMKYSR